MIPHSLLHICGWLFIVSSLGTAGWIFTVIVTDALTKRRIFKTGRPSSPTQLRAVDGDGPPSPSTAPISRPAPSFPAGVSVLRSSSKPSTVLTDRGTSLGQGRMRAPRWDRW